MRTIPELNEPLDDGRVLLRPASERDIPDVLIAHQDDPQLFSSLGLRRPPSGAELGRAIEQEPVRRAQGTGMTLTILEPHSDDCRGQLQVKEIEWEQLRAVLEIWISPQARNRDLARHALKLAAAWLFQNCGIARVELTASPANERLIRAARAAGFVAEDPLARELRSACPTDQVILSMLATDPGVAR